jgi:hypothetical protein
VSWSSGQRLAAQDATALTKGPSAQAHGKFSPLTPAVWQGAMAEPDVRDAQLFCDAHWSTSCRVLVFLCLWSLLRMEETQARLAPPRGAVMSRALKAAAFLVVLVRQLTPAVVDLPRSLAKFSMPWAQADAKDRRVPVRRVSKSRATSHSLFIEILPPRQYATPCAVIR